MKLHPSIILRWRKCIRANMQRKHKTDLSTRANKCLITHTHDRGRNTISLFTSRDVYFFFTTMNAPSSAALVSPRCSGCGIPSSLMREQRKVYKDGTKIRSSVREQRHCFPRWLDCALRPSIFILHCCPRARSTRCDVTNLIDILHGYLNFIRLRLRGSFESNRLAIGARCSCLSRECTTCR